MSLQLQAVECISTHSPISELSDKCWIYKAKLSEMSFYLLQLISSVSLAEGLLMDAPVLTVT